MRKPYETIRIDPISLGSGTGLNLGGKIGATAGGGVVDVTKGIGDFSIVCGVHCAGTASATGVTATAARYVQFSVYEATAATHAGSAISGATITLGAAVAGHLKGAVDAILTFSSKHTTAEYLTINGIRYGVGTTSADGTLAADKWASAINGNGSCQKLPHYRAWTSAGNFMGASGIVYLCADDDQATGLEIQMSAANSSGIPVKMSKLQGIININGHALSTNTPKFINVVNTTFAGDTSVMYSFMVRSGAATPAKVVTLNT